MQQLASSIQTAFDSMATADGRLLKHQLLVAWLRSVGASSFGIVGTSTVNNALVKGEVGIVTPVDTFEFFDETDKVISLEYERGVHEPLGGSSYSLMNITLDNTDLRFTPNINSTIGTALVANRPVKMAIGFYVKGVNKVLNVFKGLTEHVRENKQGRFVEVSGYDYISYLDKLEMDTAIYLDKRSDEIIEDILIEAGFGSSQYELDQGLNTIGYAWFKKTQTAGERIRMICEAEEAHFYQDENGVIRFENRRHYSQSPHNTIVWTINDDDTLEWHEDRSTPIINRCIVHGIPREAGDTTEIWKSGIVDSLEKGETKTIWAQFENPVISYETLTANTDYVANSEFDGSGDDETSNISINFSGFTETAKLEITNNSGSKVYLTKLRIRGQPAVVKSEVLQIYEDADSINKYDEKVLEIENDFIDSDTFAYYLARTIIRKYRNPLKRVRVRVRGIPHLQLKDKVKVYDRDQGTYKNYRVMKIAGYMGMGTFEQMLTLREITDYEADSWAIVGTTEVGSDKEVVGI